MWVSNVSLWWNNLRFFVTRFTAYYSTQCKKSVQRILSLWDGTTYWFWRCVLFNTRCVTHLVKVCSLSTTISVYATWGVRDVPFYRLCSFLTLFKTPPSILNIWQIFLTKLETLCTALKLDKIRHRSEEIYPKILFYPLRVFFCQFLENSMQSLYQFYVKMPL